MIFGKMDWPWYVLWIARVICVLADAARAVQEQWRRIARSKMRRRRARQEARR